jgi:two-component system OmpR family response regulator
LFIFGNSLAAKAGAFQDGLMRILLAEDDPKTGKWLREAMKAEGWAVDHLADGALALSATRAAPYDAAVVDVMMPGRDGLGFVAELRKSGQSLPVLLISARGGVDDRVVGLDAGADDYLPKPFAIQELLARVRALCRRSPVVSEQVLRCADLELDVLRRSFRRGARQIALTSREYGILEVLMKNAGRVCSRSMLLEKVWDFHFDPGSNIVDVYLRRLRQKVDAPGESKLLHAIRGAGYVLKEEP